MPKCALSGRWIEPLGGACRTFVLLEVGVQALKDAAGISAEEDPLYEGIERDMNNYRRTQITCS